MWVLLGGSPLHLSGSSHGSTINCPALGPPPTGPRTLPASAAQDFVDGHVKGAVNHPSSTFAAHVDRVIEQLGDKSKVIVHCQLSQVRGPRCAGILAQRLQELGKTQSVLVMEGGFSAFGAAYSGDAALVERESAPPPGDT